MIEGNFMNGQNRIEETEIDLLRIAKLLWHRIWIIILAMILVAALAFSYAYFFIKAKYESSFMLYVNNSTVSLGSSFSVSLSELSAAKSLLDTYIVIMRSRVTLERVNEAAGTDYTYEELYKMVDAKSVDSTEIFSVTVTSNDPAEAKHLADTILDILPERISEIVAGSSVRVVDYPVQGSRSGPNYRTYALVGLLLGSVGAAAVIIIIDLMDTTVRDEEYLNQKYSSIPVLAVIPDAKGNGSKGYGYKKYGYYYHNQVPKEQ